MNLPFSVLWGIMLTQLNHNYPLSFSFASIANNAHLAQVEVVSVRTLVDPEKQTSKTKPVECKRLAGKCKLSYRCRTDFINEFHRYW